MISNITKFENKVEFIVDIWLSKKIENNINLEEIAKQSSVHLPHSHFITYKETFSHGIKFHIVDMNGIDKSPEVILNKMEDFIKESKNILNHILTNYS